MDSNQPTSSLFGYEKSKFTNHCDETVDNTFNHPTIRKSNSQILDSALKHSQSEIMDAE